jgi:hypothetical protein
MAVRGSPPASAMPATSRRIGMMSLKSEAGTFRMDWRNVCGNSTSRADTVNLQRLILSLPAVTRQVDRRPFYHACFATRLGGMPAGKETQGWRDSSHTAIVGAGKFGSAKPPIATATYPGKPSLSQ